MKWGVGLLDVASMIALAPSLAVCLASVLGIEAAHDGVLPQERLYSYARQALRISIADACFGELSPGMLRVQRSIIEGALDAMLDECPSTFVQGDCAAIEAARSAFNLERMASMEWEYFGEQPCPEWGWDPRAVRLGYTLDPSARQ